MKYACLNSLSLILFSTSICFSQISDFIHVDQFGYFTLGSKVAVLSDPQSGFNFDLTYTPSATIELRDFNTDQVVFSSSPQIWNNGNIHAQSGDRGWWFDFSSVQNPGSYYVFDAGSNEKSAVFEINSNPYEAVLKAAVRMFYYNRCNYSKAAPHAEPNWTDGTNFNNALQDYNCRYIFNPSDASLEKDLSGGWFDAGDYNKYVTFAHQAVHELLNAYDDNPVVFGDDWNWPESDNGIPDILDEVIWELDWLMKMTNPDGSVHIKMGSQNYSDNTSAPPSLNTDQRFYGATCSSASIAAASMLSKAALVLGDFSSLQTYTNDLEATAESCFAYFLNEFNNGTLEYNCDNGEIISGDADWSYDKHLSTGVIAAIYLYELTGSSTYQNFINNHYQSLEPIYTGYWSPYTSELNEALLNYTTLANANTTIKNAIETSATDAVSNDWNLFYNFSTNDLYRAESPDWMYHWGSNLPKAGMGVLANQMKKYGIGSATNLEYKGYEQLHYFHGVNPLGMVHLSNMYALGGDRCVNEIYHTWFNDGTDYDNALSSIYGPAPGFVTGGANANYTYTALSPPAYQPPAKSYLDFNDGWPESSWEITEPAIYYQALYVRLLSTYVNTDALSTSIDINLSNSCIEVFPTGNINFYRLRGNLYNYQIEILDASGNLFESISNSTNEHIIDLNALPSGMFFISVSNNDNQNVCVKKIIKF